MPETLTGLDLFGEEPGSRGPDTLELALLVSRLTVRALIAEHPEGMQVALEPLRKPGIPCVP